MNSEPTNVDEAPATAGDISAVLPDKWVKFRYGGRGYVRGPVWTWPLDATEPKD